MSIRIRLGSIKNGKGNKEWIPKIVNVKDFNIPTPSVYALRESTRITETISRKFLNSLYNITGAVKKESLRKPCNMVAIPELTTGHVLEDRDLERIL